MLRGTLSISVLLLVIAAIVLRWPETRIVGTVDKDSQPSLSAQIVMPGALDLINSLETFNTINVVGIPRPPFSIFFGIPFSTDSSPTSRDIDSMVLPMVQNLQGLTSLIEQLMRSESLSDAEAKQLQWLMLKRAELSITISQIFGSAHESRKRIIQTIRN